MANLLVQKYRKVTWVSEREGQNRYYTQKANSLLQAFETLKKVDSIPKMTYYVVATPDGSIGRDINGLYTEAPLKTKNLIVECRSDSTQVVEFLSLKGFGDDFINQQTIAYLKVNGKYSRFILLMECGHCGYQSPIETQPGSLLRECYCCGTKNTGSRATINVFTHSGIVEI